MKKRSLLIIVTLAIVLFATASSELYARAVGLKLGWSFMRDDYKDAEYEDTASYGLFFDMGPFIFNNLNFRPGFDYTNLEPENSPGPSEIAIWAIHLDWYWFFYGQSTWAPFLGFGAALNYYVFDDDRIDDDSDAGLELFGGFQFALTGTASLLIEARYVMNDIASRDQNMFKVFGGVVIKF